MSRQSCDPKMGYEAWKDAQDTPHDTWWCVMGKIRGKWNIIHYPESLWPKSESIAARQNTGGNWLLKVIVPICTDETMHPANWQRKLIRRLEFLISEGFLTPFKDKRVDMRKFNFRGSSVE